MGKLDGKVAVITGAAGFGFILDFLIAHSGIGFEASKLFLAEGAKVVLVDIDAAAGTSALKLLDSAGAIFLHCDVSSPADVERVMTEAEKTFGRIDVLFNNAGIMHIEDSDAIDTTERVWDLTMGINAKDTASKGAVLAMTRELAVIHARENIRVNALCPGPLRTPLLMSHLNTMEKLRRRLIHIPMGRFGEAKEVAQAALFLASDDSSFITGTDFLVDGGITSAYVTPEDSATLQQ